MIRETRRRYGPATQSSRHAKSPVSTRTAIAVERPFVWRTIAAARASERARAAILDGGLR